MKYTEFLQLIKTAAPLPDNIAPFTGADAPTPQQIGLDVRSRMADPARVVRGINGVASNAGNIYSGLGRGYRSIMGAMNRTYNRLPADMSHQDKVKATSSATGVLIGDALHDARMRPRVYDAPDNRAIAQVGGGTAVRPYGINTIFKSRNKIYDWLSNHMGAGLGLKRKQ